jgi:acetyl/propionyl-CoA carboxylase alpha subunit
MTKRFTPKASDFTMLLADTQRDIAKLQRQLKELKAKEDSLATYLKKFFDQGVTEVEHGDTTLTVNYAETNRSYLDHKKVIAILAKAGKTAPRTETSVVSFKVKKG